MYNVRNREENRLPIVLSLRVNEPPSPDRDCGGQRSPSVRKVGPFSVGGLSDLIHIPIEKRRFQFHSILMRSCTTTLTAQAWAGPTPIPRGAV